MYSLKVDAQPSLPGPVFSDWGLLSSSLDEFVDEAARSKGVTIVDSPLHPHNNSIPFTVSSTQLAAYSPIEDKLYVNEDENLYGIFDGHGGDICSRFIVDKLPKHLLSSMKTRKPQHESDYVSVLRSSFTQVDDQFLNEHRLLVKTSASGSCGVTVLVRNDTLYVCNLGDSRVLLGSRTASTWKHKLLTNDHNTKNEKERQLVKQRTVDPMPIRGHAINKVPGDRVGGVLMVTRAFGDGIFKRRDMSLHPFLPYLPYITNEPEITTHKITTEDRYVVISSDGLYEYFTAEEVARIVEKQLETTQDGFKIASTLIEKQFQEISILAGKSVAQIKSIPCRKEFMDDISIIVLIFRQAPPPPSTTHVSHHDNLTLSGGIAGQ
jgi:pyruvate dehydrogenase phosphatase